VNIRIDEQRKLFKLYLCSRNVNVVYSWTESQGACRCEQPGYWSAPNNRVRPYLLPMDGCVLGAGWRVWDLKKPPTYLLRGAAIRANIAGRLCWRRDSSSGRL